MSNTPHFHPLQLEHKSLFDKYFSRFEPEISEFTFTNLYIWRHSRKCRFAELGNLLLILCEQNGLDYLMEPVGLLPVGKMEFIRSTATFFKKTIPFKRVSEAFTKGLSSDHFSIQEDRAHFDYLYSTESLAFLKGRKYDGKRGLLAKFLDNQPYQMTPYNTDFKNQCLKLAEKWAADRNTVGVDEELAAIREYLDHFDAFGCCGMVLHDRDHMIGFTFGERLNSRTFVIHFEKCDTQHQGAYQAINNLFVKEKILGNFEFINREQDLGIEGIRKAKLSYHPVKLIKKYTVTLRPS
jgi:hypothetical protein